MPVLLFPGKMKESDCFFRLTQIKSNRYTAIDYYPYMSLGLLELNVKVSSGLLNELLRFLEVANQQLFSAKGK
jgi:hypothetical protein